MMSLSPHEANFAGSVSLIFASVQNVRNDIASFICALSAGDRGAIAVVSCPLKGFYLVSWRRDERGT